MRTFTVGLAALLTSVSSWASAQTSDFAAVTARSSPSTVALGETLTVSGTVNSVGPFIGNVRVAVVLSNDTTYDSGDPVIHLGLVFIAGAGTNAFTFEFPVAVPRGQGIIAQVANHVFVKIDPDGTLVETDETNNALIASNLTIIGSDVRVVSIQADINAFSGLPLPVTVTIENSGAVDATDFNYRFYLSEDALIRIFDVELATSGDVTVPAGATREFHDVVFLPEATVTSTGTWFLGVVADINSELFEVSDTNNSSVLRPPLLVRLPIPDIVPQVVTTAPAGAAGESFAVTRLLSNEGVADASLVEYQYVLTPTLTTGPLAIPIASQSVSSLPIGDDYDTDMLLLPSSVQPGMYYIGLIADPLGKVEEIFEDNNVAFSDVIQIYPSTLQITTTTLVPAVLGVHYEAGIYATTGPLPVQFSIVGGRLPDGLVLDPGGILAGTPEEEGVFDIVVRASSGSSYADRSFAFRVLSPSVQPEIVTRRLPAVFVSRPFCHRLIGVGGQLPYEWTAVTPLPAGATLSADGFLCGTIEAPSTYAVTVQLTDDVGVAATARLELFVILPSDTIEIDQLPLPTGIVGRDLCDAAEVRFTASRGVPPFSWSIIDGAPRGVRLSAEGALCGEPERAGIYFLTIRVQDSIGLYDTALVGFEVRRSSSFAISTFALPEGQVGDRYEVDLQAINGVEPVTWTVLTETGDLPNGLSLGEDGYLSGTPTEAGTIPFALQVIDAANQRAVQPYSIVITPKPDLTPPTQGCVCVARSAGSSSGWSMLFVASLWLVLRRRTPLVPNAHREHDVRVSRCDVEPPGQTPRQ